MSVNATRAKRLMTNYRLSSELGKFVQKEQGTRHEITKAIWDYAKANKLNEGRAINCDSTLKGVFGVPQLTLTSLQQLLSKHLAKE